MKLVLIEDQMLLSSTLSEVFRQDRDIEIVGQSDKASDADQLCRTHHPDLVLMDVFTRDGNGIEVTAELKKTFPELKVLIMTGVEDERLVRAAV